MNSRPMQIGVVGLGRAFTLMLPTFLHDSRVKLVGATDPIAAARVQFEKDFGASSHDSVEALCADPAVEALYIASPHQFHAAHVCLAASFGKHVMVEKPMALSLDECTRMIEACSRAGVHLIVGHSHSFNLPIRRTREIIDSGLYGSVKMITAINYTDFLYRPRRPEELDTAAGGGVIHSQATHQMDIVRLLGGGRVSSVRAHTGAWDASRPTEGAYSALLGFENGAFASATYSGYGHYDSDELMDNIGEMGQFKSAKDYGAARRRLQGAATAADETALKAARNYGGALYSPAIALPENLAHQHFGQVIVSCEKADLRPGASGIAIYADNQKIIERLPAPRIPRSEVIDELHAAVVLDRPTLHSGEWARATTAVCLALLESARTGAGCRPGLQISHNPRA
ncbi:MAG: 4,5-dihydroxyphthalate dehydrogenase [Polaromonas sp.]|nr:4,5-dihydroxyphthalate dehydrogenase [Polaromonas sp.]